MSRPLFGFRPNLRNKAHRRAWKILQAVPEGRKNAFLVQAILEHEEKEALESTLRRVLREELQSVPSQPVQQPEEAIPLEMPCSRRKKVELWNTQKQNYKITLQKNKCKSLLNPEVSLFCRYLFCQNGVKKLQVFLSLFFLKCSTQI